MEADGWGEEEHVGSVEKDETDGGERHLLFDNVGVLVEGDADDTVSEEEYGSRTGHAPSVCEIVIRY